MDDATVGQKSGRTPTCHLSALSFIASIMLSVPLAVNLFSKYPDGDDAQMTTFSFAGRPEIFRARVLSETSEEVSKSPIFTD